MSVTPESHVLSPAEMDQQDAWILHQVAKFHRLLAAPVTSEKSAASVQQISSLKEQLTEEFRRRVNRASNLELFDVLVGENPVNNASPDVRERFKSLLAGLEEDSRRSFSELRSRHARTSSSLMPGG